MLLARRRASGGEDGLAGAGRCGAPLPPSGQAATGGRAAWAAGGSGHLRARNLRGQTMIEFLIILIAIGVISLLVAGIAGMLPKGSLNVQIGQSQAYWSSQAAPIKLSDWSMKTVNSTTPQLTVSSNLSMVLFNPTTEVITVQAISLSPGNFSQVYYSDGTWAGPADSLSIVIYPGQQKTVIAEHWASGPDAFFPPDIYQLELSFKYTMAFTSSVEAGAVPVVGGNQYVLGSPGVGCPSGLVQCGNGACAPASDCCGSTVCTAGTFCCGSTCCKTGGELCIDGACVPVAGCTAPDFKCGNNCCNATLYGNCNTTTNQCMARVCMDPNITCGSFCCPAGGKCFDENGASYGQACSGSGKECVSPNSITCGNYCCPDGGKCVDGSATIFEQACLAIGQACTSPASITCGNYCCPDGGKCFNENGASYDQACKAPGAACTSPTSVTCGNYCCPDGNACINPNAPSQSAACQAVCNGTDNVTCGFYCCANGETCANPAAPTKAQACSVPCGSPNYDASANTCDSTTCPPGLTCDLGSCTCALPPVPCGAGGFAPGVNTCKPTDNCPTGQYCQLSDCTCRPKSYLTCAGSSTIDISMACYDDCARAYGSNMYCARNGNDCTCQPKTPIACGGGPIDPTTQYCSSTVCPGGLNCDENTCTCTDKTPWSCGAGGFKPSTNYCDSTTCQAGEYCDIGTCTCHSKTTVACGSGRTFDFGVDTCTSNTCTGGQTCDTTTCTCACPSGQMSCNLASGAANCCTDGNCLQSAKYGQGIQVCCPHSTDSVCSKSDECCTSGGCKSPQGGGATVCCDASTGQLCQVYGSGPMCCGPPGTKTCTTVTPAQIPYTGPSQMCCADTTTVCHTNIVLGDFGAVQSEQFTCCSGPCVDLQNKGTYMNQQCCPTGDISCPSGAGVFYTDTNTNTAVWDQLQACCPANHCLPVNGAYNYADDPAPQFMCCAGSGAGVCRTSTYYDPNTDTWAPGHYSCCYTNNCVPYTYNGFAGNQISSSMCCASGDKVCHLQLNGKYDCCAGDCVDSPTSWQSYPVTAARPQTCCPAGAGVAMTSAQYGNLDGFYPQFTCCAAGETGFDTDSATAPQICCSNTAGMQVGHDGDLNSPNICCPDSNYIVGTHEYRDIEGRVITSKLCCQSGVSEPLYDESGNYMCCPEGSVADDGTGGTFCCTLGTVKIQPGPLRVCSHSTTGPKDCTSITDPLACSPGICNGGQVCKAYGSGCRCENPTFCQGTYPVCGGACPPGLTCAKGSNYCDCI